MAVGARGEMVLAQEAEAIYAAMVVRPQGRSRWAQSPKHWGALY